MTNFIELETNILVRRLRELGVKTVLAIAAAHVMCLPAVAQVSQEVLDSISTPDQVETSIGTLKFLDGAPYPETAEKLYDYLDTMRGVDAFLKGMPGASLQGLEAAAKNVTDNLRIYPLASKEKPPKMEFISGSGRAFNTVHANDHTFYEHLDKVIQKEPLEMLDAETRGLFASIGMEKGKPFAPDARMKKILTDAVAIANAAARSTVWYPRIDGTMNGIEVYPGKNSAWMMGWVDKNVFFNGPDGKTMNSDARVTFHYPYTAVTPAMAVTIAGVGSDYGIAYVDSRKQPLDGSKTYRLNIPANPPAKDFWALTMYDNQTRSMLQTTQRFPTVGSQTEGVRQNEDGSYDIYFGPETPAGYENNWLATVPGKGWFVALRMYGPLEPWIEKTWRPGEIELVE